LGAGKIDAIEIDTYATAVMMMAADPSRWAPTTHETADHSLPYCVSIALLDGKVTNESFSNTRLGDPTVAELMRKVKVSEDRRLSDAYPEGAPGRVTIRMVSGETHVSEVRYPRGHAKSPMSEADVERKFRDMAAARLSTRQCDAVIAAIGSLDQSSDIGRDLVELVAAGSQAR
jgi:2-methylcitrate dehydratase